MKDIRFTQFESNEERFNRTLSVLIIIVMTFLIFYFVSLSWFGESDYESGVITIGNIAVTVNTDLNFTGPLEPNKSYTKTTTIIGSSVANDVNTNDAYIRVKLETNVKISNQNIITPTVNTNNWVYDSATGWYYYVGFINTTTSATFNTALKVNPNLTNELQNQTLKIKITVHAIQREYGAHNADPDWINAPSAWKTAISAYD